MRFRSAVIGLLALPAVVVAQGGGAPAQAGCTSVAADACQQAVDFFKYMAPQLGTAQMGGNATLAQGGTLGGRRLGLIPHFAIGVRVNAVQGSVPTFAVAPQLPTATAPPAAREITTEDTFVPLPAVDLAVGVFKGFPLALSNVGGIDLLLSASYVPEIELEEYSVKPDENLALGYGVRVGLLQESLLVPGVGVSYIQRKFPVTTISLTQPTASMTVHDLDLKSSGWRVTASKSLILFGIALGAGQDTYDTSVGIIEAAAAGTSVQATPPKSKVTRTNYFGELSLNLLVLKIVAGGGMVSGGEVLTYNSFDKAANKSRMYGTAGVRIGL
jgi:hypothetical protein